MKPLLIVNPKAGGGRTGSLFAKMQDPIERSLGSFDVTFTERGRHAVEIARDAALAGRETVIAVGGDGSIHEVVAGLMAAREQGAKGTRLGIIGQGTGGDFRKTLGIEHRLDQYCAAIAGGKTRSVDVGRFSYLDHNEESSSSYFINILSIGMGGLVDQYVADASRALGGTVAYFAASLKGLIHSEIGVLNCTIHEGATSRQEEIHSRMLAICNGRYFGSGMFVAPMAELDDGMFEVVDMGAASRLNFAMGSSKIYTGAHLKSPETKHFRCDKITIELVNKGIAEKYLLDVDGEPLGRLPLEVEVMPRALEVFAPAP
jgi:YegS/Rv2252/BmrU family lipid kinase